MKRIIKRRISRPALSAQTLAVLDEPFQDSKAQDFKVRVADLALDCVVPSPIGDEFVDSDDCRRKTVVMDVSQMRQLLRECNPQRHKTVREMRAVKVP